MGTAPTPPPPPTGGQQTSSGSIQLTVTVDVEKGTLQIKNLGSALKDLIAISGKSAEQQGQAAEVLEREATGWKSLAAQVWLAQEAVQAYAYAMKQTLIDSTMAASRVEVLQTVLAVTSRNMNITTAAALAQAQAVSKLNITQRESIETIIQLERAQLNLKSAIDLARAAQDLAVVSNQNSSDALNTLIAAIQTQRVILLRQFGIVTLQEIVYNKYANAVGKSAGALTQLEKQQAFLNEILLAASKVQGAYVTAMEDAGKKMTSLARVYEDMRVKIGQHLLPQMSLLVDIFYSFGEAVGDASSKYLVQFLAALAAGVTAIASVTAAVLGLAKAIHVLTGATAAFNILANKSWVLLGATIAVTAAEALFFFKANADYAAKENVNVTRAFQAQAERLEDIRKRYEELSQAQEKIRELREEEERIKGDAGEEAAVRRVRISQELMLYAQKEASLRKDIAETDALLLKYEKDRTGGQRNWVLNMERYNELQARIGSKVNEGLLKQRETVDSLRQQLDAHMKRLQALEEEKDSVRTVVAMYGAAVQTGRNINAEKEKELKLIEKIGKELDSQVQKLADMERRGKGAAPAEMDMATIVTSLQEILSYSENLRNLQENLNTKSEAQLAILNQQKQAVAARFSDLKRNFELAASRNEQEIRLLELQREQRLSDSAALSLLDAKLAKTRATMEAQKALAVQAGKYAEVAAEISKSVKDDKQAALELTKLVEQYMSRYMNSLDLQEVAIGDIKGAIAGAVGTMLSARQQIVNYRSREYSIQQQNLRAEQETLATIDQTFGVRKEMLEIERRQFELQQKTAAIQNPYVYARTRRAVETEFEKREAVRLWQMQRELEDMRRRDALQTLQVIQQAEAVDFAARKRMLDLQYEDEVKQAMRVYDERHGLQEKLAELEKQYSARRRALIREEAQERMSRELEVQRSIQRIAEDAAQRGFASAGQIDAAMDAYEKERQLQIDLFKNRQYLVTRIMFGQEEAERQLAAFVKERDIEAFQRRRNLLQTYYDVQFSREQQLMDLESQRLAGRRTPETMSYLQQELALRRQLNDLAIIGALKEEEVKRAHEEVVRLLKEQAELRRMQQMISVAGTIREAAERGYASPEAIENVRNIYRRVIDAGREMAERWRQAAEDAFAAGDVEAATAALYRYEEAMRAVISATQGLSEIMGGMREMWLQISDAVSEAFAAMSQGQPVTFALRKMAGAIVEAYVGTLVRPMIVKESAEIASAIASGQWHKAALHSIALAAWKAVGKVVGSAVSGGLSGGGPSSGGAQSLQGTQRLEPVATRTDISDNIVRLEKALIWNGAMILRQGDSIRLLSKDLVASMEQGVIRIPQQTATGVAAAVTDKLAAASKGQEQQQESSMNLLKAIHQELVKANEKDMQIIVNSEVSVDGAEVGNLLEGHYIRSSQKYSRQLLQSVQSAVESNAGRREIGTAISATGGL